MLDPAAVLATSVVTNDEVLTVLLADGRSISVPLTWYPRLMHGTPDERASYRFIGDGEGINWPELDEDISVEGLLAGRPSGESFRSFQAWLAEREDRSANKTRRSVPNPARPPKPDVFPAAKGFFFGLNG